MKNKYFSVLDNIKDAEKEVAIKQLTELIKKYRNIKGSSDFKKNVSKAIKELKKKKVKEDRVKDSLDNAAKEIVELETWVLVSKDKLEAPLEFYLEKTKTTLGVRALPKFHKELALYLASCNANHRDLSLNF
ncbi:MAG: hypothetical protein ACJZ8K_05025 [Paracoccaceae bacterium]